MAQGDCERADDTLNLVRAAQGGDSAALERLFARCLPRVRQIVALRMGRRLREMLEIEDLVQEVLLKVLKGLERFEQRSEGGFSNWLAKLVECEVIDQRRRGERRKRGGGRVRRFTDLDSSVLVSSIMAGREPTPSALARAEELTEKLEEALFLLAEHQREVIVLRAVCGLSYAEVAAELGIGEEGAARLAFFRALKKLKALAGIS
ncbi:MAG: sigma-70 family RNA polymerase sigma factor [Planctomycetes bacterium]|nr:sigma-70 family RNA polymerase sigma factor [Planctomycetota bacterium]